MKVHLRENTLDPADYEDRMTMRRCLIEGTWSVCGQAVPEGRITSDSDIVTCQACTHVWWTRQRVMFSAELSDPRIVSIDPPAISMQDVRQWSIDLGICVENDIERWVGAYSPGCGRHYAWFRRTSSENLWQLKDRLDWDQMTLLGRGMFLQAVARFIAPPGSIVRILRPSSTEYMIVKDDLTVTYAPDWTLSTGAGLLRRDPVDSLR